MIWVLIYFCLSQAKKDLSSHCDQIVMSLATLNKQRSLDKQQPQSIKTTVTISKVSKTSVESSTPIMSQSRRIANDSVSEKSEASIASSDSQQTVREFSKSSSEEVLYAHENFGRKAEVAKERFMNESATSATAGERRGELWEWFAKKTRLKILFEQLLSVWSFEK